jgi:hypothetical protein
LQNKFSHEQGLLTITHNGEGLAEVLAFEKLQFNLAPSLIKDSWLTNLFKSHFSKPQFMLCAVVVLLLPLFCTDVLLKKIIYNRIKQIGPLRFYKVARLINPINLRMREDLHVL